MLILHGCFTHVIDNCIFSVCWCAVWWQHPTAIQMIHTPLTGRVISRLHAAGQPFHHSDSQQVLGGGGVVFDCNPTHLSQSFSFSLPQTTQYSPLSRRAEEAGRASRPADGSRVWHYMRHDVRWPAAGMLSGAGVGAGEGGGCIYSFSPEWMTCDSEEEGGKRRGEGGDDMGDNSWSLPPLVACGSCLLLWDVF